MTKDEVFDLIKWVRSKYYTTFIYYEKLDHKTETYPTSRFLIKSFDVCRNLTKDINLN